MEKVHATTITEPEAAFKNEQLIKELKTKNYKFKISILCSRIILSASPVKQEEKVYIFETGLHGYQMLDEYFSLWKDVNSLALEIRHLLENNIEEITRIIMD